MREREYAEKSGYLQTYPLGLQCDESIIPDIINPTDPSGVNPMDPSGVNPMDPIVSMLIMTNLAERLGIPQPCDVDMDWDSPEYLLWILWRCDALVGGPSK